MTTTPTPPTPEGAYADPARDASALHHPVERSASPGQGRLPWLEATAVFTLAVLFRVPGLREGAVHDELYTFLAARGYATRGTFALVEGGDPYTRASGFTRTVAAFLELFEPSLLAGRLPAVIAGGLTVLVLFLWLHRAGERRAAWIAAGMAILDPLLIQLSQVVRFYSLQHFFFLLGSALTFAVLLRRRPWRRQLSLGLAAGVSFAFATHLQLISVIGLAGVLTYVALVVLRALLRGSHDRPGLRRAIIGGALVAVAALAGLVHQAGVLGKAQEMASYADLWAQNAADDPTYYYAQYVDAYGVFLPLIPLFALLAAAARSRLATFLTTVLVVGLVAHSLVAWKAERYASYLLPFFFALTGLGIARALPLLRQLGARALDALPWEPPARARRIWASSAVAVVLLFAITGNRAYLETARLLTRDHAVSFPTMYRGDGTLSWQRFAESVGTLAPGTAVVSTDDVKAIYYLGRTDYAVSPSHLYNRGGSWPEFTLDRRVDAPVISTPESMAAIVGCHRDGLFVGQRMSLGRGVTGRGAVAEYMARVGESVPVEPRWGIVAYRWHTPPDGLRQDCDRIRPSLDLDGRPVEAGWRE